MKDLTLLARLAKLEHLADQAQQYAEMSADKGLEGSTVVYWQGVEAAYRTAIQIIEGNDS